MKNNKLTIRSIIHQRQFALLSLLFWLNTTTILGQFTISCGRSFYVEQGQQFSNTFTLDGTYSGAWTLYPNSCDYLYITASTESQATISGTIPTDGVDCDFTLKKGTDGCEFHLKVNRPGTHIMLVLDMSGSMGQVAYSGSGNLDTKWTILKGCVGEFLTRYREENATHGLGEDYEMFTEDQIGVLCFNHNRKDYVSDILGEGLRVFNSDPLPNPDPKDQIIAFNFGGSDINPSGTTCLGGGVIGAYRAFNWTAPGYSHKKRHVIVFSDGMQNRNPKYDEANKSIHSYGTEPDGFLASEVLNFTNESLEGFKIHTISIGSPNNLTLMQNLAGIPGFAGSNHPLTTSLEYTNLNDAFDDLINTIFNASSPALVNRESIVNSENPINRKYNVNNSANRILIKAVGFPKDIQNLKMEVKKGNVDFTDLVKLRGAFLRFSTTREIIKSRGAEIGGTWDVTFSGKNGIQFSINCIIDDEYIDYDCSVDKWSFIPGEPITCKLKVWAGGTPVSHLDKAMVYMLKPGTDVNDLFSNTPLPDNIPNNWPSEPGNFAGQDKFEKLIALDTAFVNRLKLIEIPQPLIKIGNGNFSTVFTGTKESGVYKFIFRFSGHDNETGTFERYFVLNKVLDFGFADISKTEYRIKWSLFKSRFEIKPINQFGHLFGPNRLENITISLNGQKLEMFDKLDGVYSVKIPNLLFLKKKKQIEVIVKNNQLFNKTISEIPKKWNPFNWLKKY